MKLFTLTFFLLVVSSASLSEIYKYTDERGRVVYSQIPPEKDAKEYSLSEGNSNNSGVTDQSSQSNFKQKKKYLDYLTEERLERKEKQEKKKQQKAELRNKCQNMRAELQYLEQGGGRYYELDEDGNRIDIGYEKVEEAMNDIRNYLKSNCSNV